MSNLKSARSLDFTPRTTASCILTIALCLSGHFAYANRPAVDPIESERKIAAILYSNQGNESMLAALSPYVAVGDTLKRFKKKTGLDPGVCFGSGPGVMHCSGTSYGLELVVDPRDRIVLIRRVKRTVDGVEYPEMSITSNCLEYKGYVRCYPN